MKKKKLIKYLQTINTKNKGKIAELEDELSDYKHALINCRESNRNISLLLNQISVLNNKLRYERESKREIANILKEKYPEVHTYLFKSGYTLNPNAIQDSLIDTYKRQRKSQLKVLKNKINYLLEYDRELLRRVEDEITD